MSHAEGFPDEGLLQDFMPAIVLHKNINRVDQWQHSHAEFAPESLGDKSNRLKVLGVTVGATAILAAGVLTERLAYYLAHHS